MLCKRSARPTRPHNKRLCKLGQAEHMPRHVCMGTSRAEQRLPFISMPTQAHAVPGCMVSHGTTWTPPHGHEVARVLDVHGCTWSLGHTGIPYTLAVGWVIPWPPGPMHSWQPWYGMGTYVSPLRLHACMDKPEPSSPGTIQTPCVKPHFTE